MASVWEQPDYDQPTAVGSPAPSRQDTLTKARANLLFAVVSAISEDNCPFGWADTPAGADLRFPDSVTYAYDVLRVKGTRTYDGSNRVTKIVFEYSDDSGSTWTPLTDAAGNYVRTRTFDGSGNYTGSTWGATP